MQIVTTVLSFGPRNSLLSSTLLIWETLPRVIDRNKNIIINKLKLYIYVNYISINNLISNIQYIKFL